MVVLLAQQISLLEHIVLCQFYRLLYKAYKNTLYCISVYWSSTQVQLEHLVLCKLYYSNRGLLLEPIILRYSVSTLKKSQECIVLCRFFYSNRGMLQEPIVMRYSVSMLKKSYRNVLYCVSSVKAICISYLNLLYCVGSIINQLTRRTPYSLKSMNRLVTPFKTQNRCTGFNHI